MSYGGYQDQGNPYGNPYTSAPNAEAGYGQHQEQHEMQNYSQPGQYGQEAHNTQQTYDAPAVSSGYGTSPQDFYSKRTHVDGQIKELDKQLNQIASEQTVVLKAANQAQEQAVLDSMVQNLRQSLSNISSQLRELKDLVGSDQSKLQHIHAVSNALKQRTARWQQLDQQFRQEVAAQIGRQARIANPDVTDSEIQSLMENGGEGGVFAQALLQNKSNQARAILGNVQARHNEIMLIENQMGELAMLFQDLDTMVVQQEEVIRSAEHQTEQTNVNIGKGNEEVDKGIVHARRARRNKWICLGITVLIILIAIAIGVGVGLTQNPPKKS